MLNRFKFLSAGLLVCGLLVPAAPVLAQHENAQGVAADTVVGDWERLLRAASIDPVLREVPAYFKQDLDQAKAQGVPVRPEVEAALIAAADEVFGFEGLRRAATAHLQASLSAEQLADWLAFYSTPLGRKLAAADERAASPAFQGLLMARAPEVMEALSRDTVRMALLQSWLQATAAVEQATDMALQSQLALEWGLISTLPQAVDKPGFEEVKYRVLEQGFAVRAQVAQLLLVHAAVAYQAFDADELGQLLQRANSQAGKALYIDFSRRLYQTLVDLAEQMGTAAGRRLGVRPV